MVYPHLLPYVGDTLPQVNFRKVAWPYELNKHVVDARERILVLYMDFIEFAIIDAYSKGPILLLHKQTGALHGEILVLLKPLSSKSFS